MKPTFRPGISVIIPTLNEQEALGGTLQAIQSLPHIGDIVVSDGGSADATVDIAHQHGCRVVSAPRGRGAQLHAGACAARGDVFWFIHADTRLPSLASIQIISTLDDSTVVVGHFRVQFDGSTFSGRLFTEIYSCAQLVGLCYGDSAYFVRKAAYVASGGFRALPLFEDLDLRKRLLRRGRFICIPETVLTSSRRFSGRNPAAMFTQWATLQLLYWLGAPPDRLARLYAHVRSARRHVSAEERMLDDADPEPASERTGAALVDGSRNRRNG